MPEYSLIVPFLTDDPVYARGVEFGMLYIRLCDSPSGTIIEEYFLLANQEQITLAASRLGWRIQRMKSWGHDWFRCRMVKVADA